MTTTFTRCEASVRGYLLNIESADGLDGREIKKIVDVFAEAVGSDRVRVMRDLQEDEALSMTGGTSSPSSSSSAAAQSRRSDSFSESSIETSGTLDQKVRELFNARDLDKLADLLHSRVVSVPAEMLSSYEELLKFSQVNQLDIAGDLPTVSALISPELSREIIQFVCENYAALLENDLIDEKIVLLELLNPRPELLKELVIFRDEWRRPIAEAEPIDDFLAEEGLNPRDLYFEDKKGKLQQAGRVFLESLQASCAALKPKFYRYIVQIPLVFVDESSAQETINEVLSRFPSYDNPERRSIQFVFGFNLSDRSPAELRARMQSFCQGIKLDGIDVKSFEWHKQDNPPEGQTGVNYPFIRNAMMGLSRDFIDLAMKEPGSVKVVSLDPDTEIDEKMFERAEVYEKTHPSSILVGHYMYRMDHPNNCAYYLNHLDPILKRIIAEKKFSNYVHPSCAEKLSIEVIKSNLQVLCEFQRGVSTGCALTSIRSVPSRSESKSRDDSEVSRREVNRTNQQEQFFQMKKCSLPLKNLIDSYNELVSAHEELSGLELLNMVKLILSTIHSQEMRIKGYLDDLSRPVLGHSILYPTEPFLMFSVFNQAMQEQLQGNIWGQNWMSSEGQTALRNYSIVSPPGVDRIRFIPQPFYLTALTDRVKHPITFTPNISQGVLNASFESQRWQKLSHENYPPALWAQFTGFYHGLREMTRNYISTEAHNEELAAVLVPRTPQGADTPVSARSGLGSPNAAGFSSPARFAAIPMPQQSASAAAPVAKPSPERPRAGASAAPPMSTRRTLSFDESYDRVRDSAPPTPPSFNGSPSPRHYRGSGERTPVGGRNVTPSPSHRRPQVPAIHIPSALLSPSSRSPSMESRIQTPSVGQYPSSSEQQRTRTLARRASLDTLAPLPFTPSGAEGAGGRSRGYSMQDARGYPRPESGSLTDRARYISGGSTPPRRG